MTRYDPTRMETVIGGLAIGQNAMVDDDLLGLARNYKRNVATRFRLLGEGDIRHIQSNDLHASIKLDGQLHFLYSAGDECFLFNANGRVVTGLKLLDEARAALAGIDSILLAGELYYRSDSGRSRVYHVTAALGSEAATRADSLGFAAFDLLQLGGEPCVRNGFLKNQEIIEQRVPETGLFHRVVQEKVDTRTLSLRFNEWVREAEQEGIVAVAADTHVIYKIKPRHTLRCVIVGFTERPDEPGAIRVLLTALVRPDGSYQIIAKIGTGFDDEQRRDLYARLAPLAVASEYKDTDRNHTLFTMVRPELVIEMAFHDLITESGTGRPQFKAVLTYDDQRGFELCLPEAFVSLLGPVFRRTLDDLAVTVDELPLSQIRDYVDLTNLDSGSRHLDLAKSEIMRREVYEKTTKGLKSIRKFIFWKTHKEEIDSHYPTYVFCFVDFSPGRQDPLKRVVRAAHSPEAIEAIFERFRKEEVKRGWSAASSA